MSSIHVASARRGDASLRKEFPNATIVNVTSRGALPWQRFSPFFPHGGVPVPFTPGVTSASVEGIWQGLKVFERAGVDKKKLDVTTMKGLKRSVRSNGHCLGHARGFASKELVPYLDARRQIFLPAYRWVLEHRVADLVEDLRKIAATSSVVLLDYETNANVDDPKSPLSHAALIAFHVRGAWPG
jgi:hypothetical protein